MEKLLLIGIFDGKNATDFQAIKAKHIVPVDFY